jgi:ABC-type transport system involved in cytochrome c biogenesis permease subunit
MMTRSLRVFVGLILLLGVAGVAGVARAQSVEALRAVPVLDAGRVKPIDTAARETVRLMTGREKFMGRDALELCLAISRDAATWERAAVLHVPLIELRTTLGLAEGTQYASPAVVRQSEEFRKLLVSASAKQRAAEPGREDPRLTRIETAATELNHRLHLFDLLTEQRRFALIPREGDGGWGFPDEDPAVAAAWRSVLISGGNETSVAALGKATGPGADASDMRREVLYHALHPFRIAWVVYLLSLLALCVSLVARPKWVYRTGMVLLLGGIAWSVFSFIWRCSITGWAPVTNIYETVIWVALVGSIVAVAIELTSFTRIPAIAGALAATASGLVADVMPPEYGSAVRNLMPVLQSNLWLTVHVLTIVSSYAAFLVALVIGNVVVGQFAFAGNPRAVSGSIAQNLHHLYRALQVGVLLVAAGTILGGLWADVSWGRFWGWDPKEVWALVILLTYVALLHGRFAGWVKPFGLAAGSIAAFLTVLMSWYGVNFVLGAGLHSYGFGTGGQGYVAVFALLQLGYLGVCWWRYRARREATRETVSPSPRDRDAVTTTV